MTPSRKSSGEPSRGIVRAAIYTRKSTEEGLEQAFNSLDHQREACAAYARSQSWQCPLDRYDDGGFSGGNLERPALRLLMADIEAGKVDVVLVYKVDRLSRSLLHFARLIESFEKHHVAFVCVTQQFNTATSMGRLVLNVLLPFAQFEREIISERTRDKIAATRRKGKWSGGMPILGYDVAAGPRLVVNESEAAQVRAMFGLYLQLESLLAVVQALGERGWVGKRWTSKKGHTRGGRPLTKTSLHKLVTNATYAGLVVFQGQTYQGEHAAIIDTETWQRVQALLSRNGRTGGALVRNKFGALLKGLLRCVPCGCAMTPSHSTRGSRRYRYYTCSSAQKRGHSTCPSKSIPAGEIEGFVVAQIKRVGRDPVLIDEVMAHAREQTESDISQLESEQRLVRRELSKWHDEIRTVALQLASGDVTSPAAARLADLQERVRGSESRLVSLDAQLAAIHDGLIDRETVAEALGGFDDVWAALAPQEQARVIHLMIEQVTYDGTSGRVSITFRQSGLRTLAQPASREDAA